MSARSFSDSCDCPGGVELLAREYLRRAGRRRRAGGGQVSFRARRRLCAGGTSASVRQLFLLPRAGRGGAPARPAARYPGGAVRGSGQAGRTGGGRRERGRQPPVPAACYREQPPADAAGRRPADGRADRDGPAVDRPGSGVGDALGVHPARAARASAGIRSGMGSQSDRRLRSGAPGCGGARAVGGGGPCDAAAAGDARPDRVAADAGRAGRVPERRFPGCVREGGRPAAGLGALRRADGVGMVGRGPLRRYQWIPDRRRAVDVALARLGDRRLQREHAVRSIHDRAARGRHAAQRDPRSAHSHRVQPQPQPERRRGHRRRRVPGRVRGRSGRDHLDRLARPDAGLRPLPRPQVRPDLAEGVLRGSRQLQQYSGARQGVQVRQLTAAYHCPHRRAGSRAGRARRKAAGGARGVRRHERRGGNGAGGVGAVAPQRGARRLDAARRSAGASRPRRRHCRGPQRGIRDRRPRGRPAAVRRRTHRRGRRLRRAALHQCRPQSEPGV